MVASIYLKRFVGQDPPYSLVILAGIGPNSSRAVSYVFKVFPDLVEGFAALSPVNVLRALADRFGVDVDSPTGQRGSSMTRRFT